MLAKKHQALARCFYVCVWATSNKELHVSDAFKCLKGTFASYFNYSKQ